MSWFGWKYMRVAFFIATYPISCVLAAFAVGVLVGVIGAR